ncbi:MATE family efflux transporter, partial [Turicibacter sanguinis]|nr:MATE family efflux transporter [Turicibacter sanguinis]
LIYILPTPLVSFFNPDKTFINTTVTELKLYAFSLPLCALSLTAPNFFQSIGNSKLSIWLVIIRQMIILIPALIILPRLIGLNGVWLAQPITDLSVSLLCFFLIKKEFKRLSSVN